ncbi:MAG: hypothetical protein ACP5OA_03415 [Candidatus Woesearchaeota archaeon]
MPQHIPHIITKEQLYGDYSTVLASSTHEHKILTSILIIGDTGRVHYFSVKVGDAPARTTQNLEVAVRYYNQEE